MLIGRLSREAHEARGSTVESHYRRRVSKKTEQQSQTDHRVAGRSDMFPRQRKHSTASSDGEFTSSLHVFTHIDLVAQEAKEQVLPTLNETSTAMIESKTRLQLVCWNILHVSFLGSLRQTGGIVRARRAKRCKQEMRGGSVVACFACRFASPTQKHGHVRVLVREPQQYDLVKRSALVSSGVIQMQSIACSLRGLALKSSHPVLAVSIKAAQHDYQVVELRVVVELVQCVCAFVIVCAF